MSRVGKKPIMIPDGVEVTPDGPATNDTVVTREMITAGVKAADLIGFRWGWDSEESLVSRVYLAMDAALSSYPCRRAQSGERKLRERHS